MNNFDLYIASGDSTLLEEALLGKADAARRLGMTGLETATLRAFIEQFPQSLHRRRASERLSQLDAASAGVGE